MGRSKISSSYSSPVVRLMRCYESRYIFTRNIGKDPGLPLTLELGGTPRIQKTPPLLELFGPSSRAPTTTASATQVFHVVRIRRVSMLRNRNHVLTAASDVILSIRRAPQFTNYPVNSGQRSHTYHHNSIHRLSPPSMGLTVSVLPGNSKREFHAAKTTESVRQSHRTTCCLSPFVPLPDSGGVVSCTHMQPNGTQQ